MARTPKKRHTARKTRPVRRKAARAKSVRKRARPAPRARKPKKTQAKRRAKAAPKARTSSRSGRAKRRTARRTTRKARSTTPRTRKTAPPRKAAAQARKTRPLPPRSTRPAGHPPLDRARRVLSDDERLEIAAATSRREGSDDRMVSSARAGHDALRAELRLHTESSPALTAGDSDAKWQDAYAVGDEAPGGDNPTPDQDRVDDIGKALGIQYQDDQELQGGDEVVERDRHRWELDPASSEDWPHDKKS